MSLPTTRPPWLARWYERAGPYDSSVSDVDRTEPSPEIREISGRINAAWVATRPEGAAVDRFSASTTIGWAYLVLEISYGVPRVTEVPLEVVEYYEDGFTYRRHEGVLEARPEFVGGKLWYTIGPGLRGRWAPGRYGVNVYAAGQKVADVEFLVTEN